MTYSLTSKDLAGEVLFTYNDKGLFINMEIVGEITQEQHIYLLKWLPVTTDNLFEWQKKHSHLTIVEVIENVTHDMFWDRYNDKVRSSKKKSLTRWNKHTKANQVKAYNFIPRYESNRGTAEKKYAETYLNAELWNN